MSEKKYITIRGYFEEFLDNEECRVIQVIPREVWAKSKQQNARIKLYLPNEICGENLKDLDNWHLNLIAIPMKEIEKLRDKKG